MSARTKDNRLCILANWSGHVCICTLYDVECLITYLHLLNFREVIPMS